MTVSYTTDISGAYLTSITNAEATIDLTAHVLATYHTRNVAADSYAAEPIDAGGSVISQTVDPDGSFHTTIGSVAGGASVYSMTVHGVVDAASESIKFRPQFAMGAAIKATYSWYGASMEWVLQDIGNASDCMVVLPSTMGIVVPLLDDTVLPVDAEVKWSYPGLQSKGSGSGANVSTHPYGDFSANVASFFPVVALYNQVTGVGAILRLSGNNSDRACTITLTRYSNNDIRVAFRMMPIDHATGVNGASDEDMGYSVQVRPFLSPVPNRAWYDVVNFHRAELIRENHPSMTAARIVDRPSTGAGSFPDRIRNLAAFGAMTQGDTTDPDFNFDLYSTNTANIVSGFESLTASQLLQVGYNLTVGDLGAGEPDQTWAPGAASAMSSIFDSGAQVGIYTIQYLEAAPLLASGLDIIDDAILDEDQDPLTTGSSGFQYLGFDWLNTANVAALCAYQVGEITDGVGTDFSVVYMDALNVRAGQPNLNSALDPEDRGNGATTYQPAIRAAMDSMRSEMASAGVTTPAVFTEHPSPTTVGASDLCFQNIIGPGSSFSGDAAWDYVSPRIPSFAQLYSERIVLTDFESFGDGPTTAFSGLAISGFASVEERFNSLYSLNFHAHSIPSFLRYFEVAPTSVYFPDDAPATYADWADFVDGMCFKRAAAVRHWHRCRKLRDLDGSQHVRSIAAWKAQSFAGVVVDAAKLHHSVVYDPDADELIVRVTNWSLTGHNPAAVALSDTLTVAGWPEMGSGARDSWLWNLDTGAMLPLPGRSAGASYAISLTIPAGFRGAILMPLAGTAPVWGGDVDQDPISWTGDQAGAIAWTGDQAGAIAWTGAL